MVFVLDHFDLFAIDAGGLVSVICNYDIGPRYEGDDGLCGEVYNTNSLSEAVDWAREHYSNEHTTPGEEG